MSGRTGAAVVSRLPFRNYIARALETGRSPSASIEPYEFRKFGICAQTFAQTRAPLAFA
jgi:hypothetical protein